MRLLPRIAILAWASAIAWLNAAGSLADEPYGRHQFEPHIQEHWAFQKLKAPAVPSA